MTTTQSMKRFDVALDRFRDVDAEFINKLYWSNTCERCSEEQSAFCGRAHEMLQMMGRLTFSVPVQTEGA